MGSLFIFNEVSEMVFTNEDLDFLKNKIGIKREVHNVETDPEVLRDIMFEVAEDYVLSTENKIPEDDQEFAADIVIRIGFDLNAFD